MLMLSLGHSIMQKQGGKKDVIRLVSSSGFKMIFILLTKIIIVQVIISIVEVREVGI